MGGRGAANAPPSIEILIHKYYKLTQGSFMYLHVSMHVHCSMCRMFLCTCTCRPNPLQDDKITSCFSVTGVG